MSSARNDFCESASRPPFGCSLPRRYGRRGCMPLPVKSVVGSFCGTSGAEGITECPLSLKNSRYFVRISLMFIPLKVTCFLRNGKRRRNWCGAPCGCLASRLHDAKNFDDGGDSQCRHKDEQDDSASTPVSAGFLFILGGHHYAPPFLLQIYASSAGCKGWLLLPLEI